MCEYVKVNIIDCEEKIQEWINTDISNTLIISFFDYEKTFVKREKYYEYCKYQLDLFEVIEEIQTNLVSNLYPEYVLITFKNRDTNPHNDNMVQWNEKSLENTGYWYIICHKINITI